ncbi:helix-turn-helix domain-containing protein [Pedobacter sp.]|uniref:helix-turn-helix domain-containing protein n=1 Tax=Pedobacter sp. TaxID=1411316 RepID=UPI003BA84F87
MNTSERIDLTTKDYIHVCRSSDLNKLLKDIDVSHRWPYFFILFAATDHAEHCIENERIPVPLGHFLFVGPDRFHAFIEAADNNFWVIYFDYGFYARTPNDAYFIQNTALFFDLSKIYISKPSIDIAEYVTLQFEFLEKLVDRAQAPLVRDIIHNAVQAMLIRSAFLSQGLHSSDVQHTNAEDKKIATRFRELLHLNYQREKKLDYYANAIKTTPRRLNQAITNIYGRSAKQLVTEKIFEEAKSKLAHSALTIKEISYSMGFTEENNFSAFFTKHSGFSPKKYRNLQVSLSMG